MRRLVAATLVASLAVLALPGVVVAQDDVPEEGLAVWFDAADYDESEGLWLDRSGRDNHATQSNAAQRPLYVDSELNGHPVVSFPNRCCSVRSAPFDEPLGQPNTIFLVGRAHFIPTSGSFNYFIDGHGNGRHALYALTSGNWSAWAGARGETNLVADTEWNVHSVAFNGNRSLLWVNGVSSRPAVNVGSDTMTGITIGGHFNVNLLAGDIAEILVYDRALDDEERLAVETHLQAKYGIEPAVDPYQMGQGTEDRDWIDWFDGREPDPTSSERYPVQTLRNQKIPMRDGTLLDADLFIPDMPDGPGPCVVIADGYGRTTYQFGVAARGYALVHAALRGAGRSEGESGLYHHYAEDSYDLVEWAAAQPWCDGNVGMHGTSLVGISQWLAAKAAPPSLKAIVPDVACGDCYEYLWYPGGMLPGPGREDRERFGPEYTNAIQHRDYDDWWRERTTTAEDHARMAADGLAVLATGGWQDYITPGMVQAFEEFAGAGGQGKLIVAAGAHNGHQTAVNGPYHYAEHLVLFFDHFLRGEENEWVDGTYSRGHALIWVNGPDQFRYEETWPIPDTRSARMHLSAQPSGSIGSLNDGSLQVAAPGDQPSVSYSYDPEEGPFLRTMRHSAQGITRVDQAPYESQVLTWTTGALEVPTEVTGKVEFDFWASATAEDTDFVLMVSDVAPDGTSQYVTSGYLNAPRNESRSQPNPLVPGEIRRYFLDTQATSYVFSSGHRIRFSLAGGTTGAPGQGSAPQGPGKNPNPADVTVYQDAQHPSSLVVPVIGTAALPGELQSQSECMDGRWAGFGFANQGQCVRYVVTGKDSR